MFVDTFRKPRATPRKGIVAPRMPGKVRWRKSSSFWPGIRVLSPRRWRARSHSSVSQRLAVIRHNGSRGYTAGYR